MAELKLADLSFHYGSKQVLGDVSFNVKPGELICLVGPSGCGKSTLLRLIAGLTNMLAGNIYIGDKLLASNNYHMPVQKRNVGLVFQHASLFPHLTVGQNIMFGIKHLNKQQRQARQEELLEMIYMQQFAERLPHTLSGGQQQRVALARALAVEPDIMLLDEPFGMLDSLTRGELQDILIEIWNKEKITAVMITHDVDEAIFLADRVVMMTSGPSAKIGDILTIDFERPRTRKSVLEHDDYYMYRKHLIDFLEH